jgi:3-oxoacyl-[acyl-carrier protein] reductase
MDLGLHDRVFLVTGGTSGLGLATAEVLVAEGARVVVSGRNRERVEETTTRLGGEVAVGVTADNADPGTPDRLVAAARERFGRLDGGLISVGGPRGGTFLDSQDADWSSAVDSVLLGGVRLARTLGRELGDGGSIAFVLSTSVKEPLAGLAISNALRPGLAMLAKTLADEVGPRGIRVNGLMPGRVDTPRVQELDQAAGDAAKVREQRSAGIPLRRYGEPAEFGRVAAFLLSPAASFVSGAMIPVDGGMLRAL